MKHVHILLIEMLYPINENLEFFSTIEDFELLDISDLKYSAPVFLLENVKFNRFSRSFVSNSGLIPKEHSFLSKGYIWKRNSMQSLTLLQNFVDTNEQCILKSFCLEHTSDKNGSTWPAFLWQNVCQNHFGNPNRSKIHIRGCKWLKFYSNTSSNISF